MNTRKKLLLTVLLVALGGMYASAQISYNDFMALKPKEKKRMVREYFSNVSHKEQKIRMKELQVYDVKDLMQGSSADLPKIRQELLFYGEKKAMKGAQWMFGGYGFMIAAPVAGVLVGILADTPALIIGGLGAGLAVGIPMVVKGATDIMAAGDLDKKCQLLVADVPMVGSDHLALSFDVLFDNWTQTRALGAGVALSF